MVASKPRIVYIEDHPEMIDLVRLILGRHGYEVIGAIGGVNGLEVIEREQPDLVLLDLMMPDLDGWEVYRRMLANPQVRDTPVIVITAKAQSIDRVLGLYVGKVADYITKPFGPSELVKSVQQVLGQPVAEAVG